MRTWTHADDARAEWPLSVPPGHEVQLTHFPVGDSFMWEDWEEQHGGLPQAVRPWARHGHGRLFGPWERVRLLP